MTQLPESALAWILEPLGRSTSGKKFTPHCHCGLPAHIPAMQPGYEGGGDVTDHMWLCAQHRKVMQSITGVPGSPGGPPDPPHKASVKRLRGLSRRLSAARSQQPAPPQMPRPSGGRPSASEPSMPVVGPR